MDSVYIILKNGNIIKILQDLKDCKNIVDDKNFSIIQLKKGDTLPKDIIDNKKILDKKNNELFLKLDDRFNVDFEDYKIEYNKGLYDIIEYGIHGSLYDIEYEANDFIDSFAFNVEKEERNGDIVFICKILYYKPWKGCSVVTKRNTEFVYKKC